MFLEEKPIESKKDDFLGRYRFASNLADTICQQKKNVGFVVSIYGKWGSGKSSTLNLILEHIREKDKKDRPTIIQFNPWMVSGQSDLFKHFFNEISKELEIRNEYDTDKKLASNFRAYGNLFGSISQSFSIGNSLKFIISAIGFFGLVTGYFLTNIIQIIVIVFSAFMLILGIFANTLVGYANFIDEKLKLKEKSLSSMKNTIVEALKKRAKILLIVIDDIDRLSKEEIKLIFQLIKVNSDFPNTLYLLTFDRDVVEKQLIEPGILSGSDFIEKIVQVHFDIPDANRDVINEYLFSQLDITINNLPKKSLELFEKNYWGNIYHSGFKQFFESIRSIKRYISSLRFNLKMLVNADILEVNPLDFMVIEVIRVFCPRYYEFMKSNKHLFTELYSGSFVSGGFDDQRHRNERANESLKLVDSKFKEPIKGMLERVFPGVFDNTIYGEEWWPGWSRDLRARHPDFFDAYFTLTPGGDERKLSQYEFEAILNSIHDSKKLELKIRDTISSGKIRQVLSRLQDYTPESSKLPRNKYKNLIQALFNISDNLPEQKNSMFDSGALMDIQRILYQLAKRENDPSFFGEVILQCIKESTALSAPIETISHVTPRDEDDPREIKMVKDEDLKILQKACFDKVEQAHNDNKLINLSRFLYILYRLREWDFDDFVQKIVMDLTETDEVFIMFVNKFYYVQESYPVGDYTHEEEDKFNFKGLKDFLDLKIVQKRVKDIIVNKTELYERYKKGIDLFINGVDQQIDKKI